jgi:catalase
MTTNIVPDTLRRVKAAMTPAGDKLADMARNTIQPSSNDRYTTDYGVRQANNDDWLKVASEDKTGPMLLEDAFAREKIHRFDHERIPERVVHARGTGAFGTFKLFESASDVTMAPVLTDTARETPVFVRFSTVLGSRGSADTVRDVRGFAVKFYTQEGNWDIVGNNIPVFFIQDALKFPDVIHAGKPEPHNEVPQAQSAHNNFWDFQFMHPEATHMFMWAMSDRAIPRSYRMMQGFGVNTFTLINSKNERHFVKFHWTPELGVHSFVWDEALKLAGQDPDFHRKDLEEAINSGAYPRWKFGIQVIPESQEHDFDFDILDATKVWPEDKFPVRYIGQMELNRMPDEFFTQTEQVAFCTSHLVPGVGFSDDPLLQGRNFSYQDTQITRLGVNWEELPINRPICPVMNFNRDGAMRHTVAKGTVNYWPNRFTAIPPTDAHKEVNAAYIDYEQKIAGVKKRMRSAKFRDTLSQAQLFFNSLSQIEQKHVLSALGFELSHCDDPVVYERMIKRLSEIDLGLAQSAAELVGGEKPETRGADNHGRKTINLSQFDFMPKKPTVASRRIAIIIADGFDSVAVEGMRAAILAASALPWFIGAKRSKLTGTSGVTIMPDHHLEGQRSTMFDAIFVAGGKQSVDTLRKSGRALHWVREAFGHLKAIGASGEAVDFVRTALSEVAPSLEFSSGSDVVEKYGVVTLGSPNADSFKEALELAKGAKAFVDNFFHVIAQHRCFERELDGLAVSVAF